MTEIADLAALSDEELAKQPFDELVAALQRTVQILEAGNAGLERSGNSRVRRTDGWDW